MKRWLLAIAFAGAVFGSPFRAAEPVRYRFSVLQPVERWIQVEFVVGELDDEPLELRMSRSSPGRYSAHDFARNVYDVHAYSADGRELRVERKDQTSWTVPTHGPSVSITYKVFGDRLEGTYTAVDSTHAHLNMPATVMWARGLGDRPATLTFDVPAGTDWQIATQLYPGTTATEFTAPNLQYLMDSPVEIGPLMVEVFVVGRQTFRFAAHHTGTRMDLQGLVRDVARIVAQHEKIYGEFPSFEPGTYTFIADYLPHAIGDAMEHRNSTVITSPGTIANAREELLDAVSHEFFHAWNVERIRPKSLEPFDLTRANPSAELWFAEGFTQYYGPLAMQRAGLLGLDAAAGTFTMVLNAISAGAGRLARSAEEISRRAPEVEKPDGTSSPGVISYYYVGSAIAMALDLSLRQRSGGRVSLDDFMRRMWHEYGRSGTRAGYVDRPYTVADLEATLATVSGDRAFAHDFFRRYIRGRQLADYGELLKPAGFIFRPAARGRVEVVTVEATGGSLTAEQRAFREAWLGAK